MGKGTGQRQVAERNVHQRSAAKARRPVVRPPVLGVGVRRARVPNAIRCEASPRRHYPIRVLIADDDEMVRQTLLEAIEQTDGIVVIGTAKDAAEAIRIASMRHPDVALLDVRMPAGAAHALRARSDGAHPTPASSPSPRIATSAASTTCSRAARRATW